MKPRHIHHIFFPIGDQIVVKGLIRFSATEIYIYHNENISPKIPEFLEKEISIHKIKLNSNYHDAIEQINEDFEDLIQENMLVCINLNDCNTIISQSAILYLANALKKFHSKDRPCLEPYATAMYYRENNNYLEGYPIIPQSPEPCTIIFRILSKSQDWLSKEQIQDQINIVENYISEYQITNALIILENWLKFYPGFNIRQKKQRKKEYMIKNLSEI